MELTKQEQQWMAALRGRLCHEHEWLAAGAIGESRTLIGLCRPPQDGEPDERNPQPVVGDRVWCG